MGLFNVLHYQGTCPHCGRVSELRAQFDMGTLEQRSYVMGEPLDWSGPNRRYDPPETGYFADYGYAYCRVCDGAWWVWLTVEGNAVVRVEPSEGPVPFIGDSVNTADNADTGILNRLRFEGTCPHCGHAGELIAEFAMGTLERRFYGIGEQLDWSRLPRMHEPPEDGDFADHGFASCPVCRRDWWVWLILEGNAVVRVEPSEGP